MAYSFHAYEIKIYKTYFVGAIRPVEIQDGSNRWNTITFDDTIIHKIALSIKIHQVPFF
jgi:hypothetical protein